MAVAFRGGIVDLRLGVLFVNLLVSSGLIM